ncbi:hypothetical protein O6H91_Y133300 [Diphasiastrum complanatum]|nr:hypothetical protein O6H91_Y133300 [Diphasiastrum complanatum]KAJ7296276.1 hypothetical protein O6H91_Y133300 [Diphasiastrum complanatum]
MKCFYLFQYQRKENNPNINKSKCWPYSISGSNQAEQRSGSEKSQSTSGPRSGSEKQSQTASDTSCSSSSPSVFPTAGYRLNELRIFKLSELKAATRNFNVGNFLGEGGFGCVYRGWIRHKDAEGKDVKLEVAVKRLNTRGHQGHKEWLSEVKYLGLVNHPNLVKLEGYCVEDDARGIQLLLVYEYMPNKSLEAHLFGTSMPVLSWERRLQIAIGAAHGLVYLHQQLDFQIIYRDFKSSNILLDNGFMPKLSDFGLAREGPDVGATHVTTEVVGTMGYAAPEYVHTGHLTSKSDVWGFGIVLLELLTGRKALNSSLPKNEQWLLEWAKPYMGDPRKVHKILDPRLEEYSLQAAQKLFSLACQCLVKNPKSRPTMNDVVSAMKQIMEPPTPGSIIINFTSDTQELEVRDEKDRPSLNPREKYQSLKEEMNLKMKESGNPVWQKLAKPKTVRTL